MTQAFPQKIADAMPPDNELVGGTVTAINPLEVDVRGGIIPPGVLGSYIPSVGDPVQLLRQDATWLVLGSSVSGTDTDSPIVNLNTAATVQTTTSATYVNVTNFAVAGFTKRLDATDVRVDFHVSLFLTGAVNTQPRFGVDFIAMGGGAVSQRFDLVSMLINPVSQHTFLSCSALLSGLTAGTYSIQVLWLRVAGAGTLARGTDDWNSITVAEVA